jgi:AcrR family transcriptional regulator
VQKRAAVRRDYHHGDLRSALLDSVARIVRENGPSFVSVREVARRARVSHAAPAHHFRNKSGLLTAFAAQGFDRLADMMGETIAASRAHEPPDVLAAMGRGYVRFALEHPAHFAIMFRDDLLDTRDEAYVRASGRAYGPLIGILRTAAEQGYLESDPVVVAASAWSLVHGLATLWLGGRLPERTGASDPHALADAVTALFVSRVMRSPSTPRRGEVTNDKADR